VALEIVAEREHRIYFLQGGPYPEFQSSSTIRGYDSKCSDAAALNESAAASKHVCPSCKKSAAVISDDCQSRMYRATLE